MLVAIIRNPIFEYHDNTVTEADMRELLLGITGVEIKTCLLICNRIMPYVPSKKKLVCVTVPVTIHLNG